MAQDIKDRGGVRVLSSAITVRRTPDDTYEAWRNLSALPQFMRNVISVTEDGERSHWVVDAPGGQVEWDAEITADIPGRVLRWQSVEDADVPHRGEIRFEKARQGRGTEVYVTIGYRPPAGVLGVGIAKLTGNSASRQMEEDLHRFKQFIEVGTISTTHGQPRGDGQRDEWRKEQKEPAEQPAERTPDAPGQPQSSVETFQRGGVPA